MSKKFEELRSRMSPESRERAEAKAQSVLAADNTADFPAAVAVRYDRRVSRLVITLATGLELAFSPKRAQGLEHAHPADLVDAEITPSGLGIHFPKLDAGLYIPALLEGFFGSKRWMAENKMGKIEDGPGEN